MEEEKPTTWIGLFFVCLTFFIYFVLVTILQIVGWVEPYYRPLVVENSDGVILSGQLTLFFAILEFPKHIKARRLMSRIKEQEVSNEEVDLCPTPKDMLILDSVEMTGGHMPTMARAMRFRGHGSEEEFVQRVSCMLKKNLIKIEKGILSPSLSVTNQGLAIIEGDPSQDTLELVKLLALEDHMLLEEEESTVFERKPYLRWNSKKNVIDKNLENDAAEVIAAFMNSHGGVLLIGQDDNKGIIGVQNEYETLPEKKNQEGYEQRLNDISNKMLGREKRSLFTVRFFEYENNELCRVEVKRSVEPVFIRRDGSTFFVMRQGPRTQLLDSEAQYNYIRTWFSDF